MAGITSTWFDGRLKFNAEVFTKYVDAMPRTKTYAFMNSGIVQNDARIASAFGPEQVGSYSQTMPIYGDAEATEENYDGSTPMPDPGYQDTYARSTVAYGRQFSLAEKDFSYDLIPGADFGEVLRKHIATNRDNKFEKRLLSITNTLFSFETTGDPDPATAEGKFAKSHTTDISGLTADKATISDTTLNDALQKASREFKGDYTMIAVHSQVATNLENKKLLEYAKGVDENGVVKDLGIQTWNGKTLVIDDSLPYDAKKGTYTSYAFGRGAFGYANLPVKTPYEPVRDADNAIDKMYIRYREVIAPKGFSFVGTLNKPSPSEADLAKKENWKLADNGKTDGGRKTFPIERIPIVKIVSKG